MHDAARAELVAALDGAQRGLQPPLVLDASAGGAASSVVKLV